MSQVHVFSLKVGTSHGLWQFKLSGTHDRVMMHSLRHILDKTCQLLGHKYADRLIGTYVHMLLPLDLFLGPLPDRSEYGPAEQGWFEQNPGTDVPVKQLTRGQVTDNSSGFHLGRMPEIRTIIEEECEKALAGQQGAQQALNSAVERGNKVLRDFQKSVRT